MNVARKSVLMTVVAAALWGTWSLFLHWAGLPGLTSGAIFMTFLAVSGIPAQWKNRKRVRPASAWGWMAVFGVFDACNTGFFFLAVTHGPVAAATLSHYLAPLLTPIVAFVLLRERPSARTYPAAAVGLVGLFLLMRPSAGMASESASHLALTCAYGAASAVFYATLLPFGKKLGPYFTPQEVQGIHSWLSAALLWLVAPQVTIGLAPAAKVLLGSSICGVFAGILIYRAVRDIPAGLASVLTYVEPVVASSIGALVFHEALGPTALVGAVLVLGGGVYLAAETFAAPAPIEARSSVSA